MVESGAKQQTHSPETFNAITLTITGARKSFTIIQYTTQTNQTIRHE